MNRTEIGFALLVLGACMAPAKPPEHTVSSSEQFMIYGDDRRSRGAISEIAERTKSNLLSLLHLNDNWKTPVVINAMAAQANLPELPPAALYFSQTGFGLKIQLDLTIGSNWKREQLEHELLRALLLEMMYRNNAGLPAGTTYVEPPEWLIEGLMVSTADQDREPFITALSAAKTTVPLADFLQQRPDQLDSPGRQLYRGYAFGLVQLLLQFESGRTMARYVDKLASGSSNDPLADLERQFPPLDQLDLTKLWQSHISRMRVEHQHQLFTFAETERRLQELLKSSVHLSECSRRKISETDKLKLTQLKFDLLLLEARANPVLRSTVQDYQRVVVGLLRGKNRGIDRQLIEIESLHRQIAARLSEIDDYLNWFEAAKLEAQSGLFSNYLSAANDQNERLPHRRDPLSIYLDALEEQF